MHILYTKSKLLVSANCIFEFYDYWRTITTKSIIVNNILNTNINFNIPYYKLDHLMSPDAKVLQNIRRVYMKFHHCVVIE